MTTQKSPSRKSPNRKSPDQKSPSRSAPSRRRGEHLVRPRLVWGGLAAALVGACLLGLGIAILSLVISIIGVVLLLAGAATSVAGGVMYDAVPALAAGREVKQVVEGDVHPGVAPGEMERSRRALDDATASSETARAALGTRPPVHPPLAPLAGWVLVAITALVVLAQPWLVGDSGTGHDSSLRDTGLAILVGLCGLRIAVSSGRHPIAGGLALVAGVCLVLGGLLAAHDHRGLAVFEVTCGVVVVLAALGGLLRPSYAPVGP